MTPLKPKVWRGWTLQNPDGSIALSTDFRDPYIWKLRLDAKDCAEEGQKVMRCELRIVSKGAS